MIWTTETLLKAIDQHGLAECVTEQRLAELTGYSAKQIENACQNLRRHAFIERTGKGCHRLTAAGKEAIETGYNLRGGPRGPQQNGQRRRDRGMRQRIWNCLRMGKKVTIGDIAMLAVTGEERDPLSNIRKYLTGLKRAGYVLTLKREKPLNPTSNGSLRWVLISDTGPAAPVIRVSRQTVFDPNLEQEIAMARGEA